MTYEQLYEYCSTLRDKRVIAAKLCCEEARFDAEARVEMMDMILDAIDKQISKKPIKDENNGWLIYRCPICGKEVGRMLETLNHHCKCGQAISWEEEE